MATIICPNCKKPNINALEICQFCGTPLKNHDTEPLPTIHPGEMPVKQQTSELENTLPAWLRDMRKGDDTQSSAPTPAAPSAPSAPQTPKPEIPQKKDASPLDFLAGLSQLDDEEEAEPDWLTSLKGNSPSEPTPAAKAQPEAPVDWMAGLSGNSSPETTAPIERQNEQPVDWLSAFEDDSQPKTTEPETSAMDWGFNNLTDEPEKPVSDWGFNDLAEEPVKPAAPASEETPDWLAALKAQDTSVNAPAQPKSEDFSFEDTDTSSGNFPDWLSNLGGESAPAAEKESETFPSSFTDDSPSTGEDDLSGWLAGMSQSSASPVTPAVEPTPSNDTSAQSGDFPDWLANLGGETTSTPQKEQPTPSISVAPMASQDSSADAEFPDWLSNLGGETTSAPQKEQPAPNIPAAPMASQDSSADAEFPDWLSNLGGETTSTPQKEQPTPSIPVAPMASQDSSAEDTPSWLSGLTGEEPAPIVAETPLSKSASIFDNLLVNDEIGWLEPPAQEKPVPEPATPPMPTQKAFSTGSLDGLTPLNKADDVPDWLAGLNATTPKKASEPAVLPNLPDADAFDWLNQSNAAAGQPESAVEKPKAPAELSTSAFLPDASQNLDSIFSMEMPDWLSGFTPSEPATPTQTAGSEQPAAFNDDNLSPAELPSWVQAMRPIESMVSSTQSNADDQIVEQEGPLAGLRSVLPAQVSVQGVRKPKAYSIKLQVDSTQLAQATLLENLIASEAESRPVVTTRRVVNFRSLRWVIAVVLLLVTLVPGIIGGHFFPLPDASNAEAKIETINFHKLVEGLPDAAKVLVIFDYQPGYAGEMEQAAGPVINHLMSKNAHMAFVSTLPTGVLMSERIMVAQNILRADDPNNILYKKGTDYIDLGYLPGDAAGIQVFAENPDILGHDNQDGNLWAKVQGLDQIQKKLSNFNAAIVLTDNPDTGRMWIEQAGAALDASPLLMVVSAQAAPMIFPYYESRQVEGLVSGLAGGALYEIASGQPKGKASFYYWDSYGAGMIAAEVLIVIGGVWALIQRLRTRRAEQNHEEDEE